MRRKNLGWLAGVSALAGLMVVGQPALAKQSEEPVQINSFSGAYLAARVAEVDNDLDSAIAYYKRALAFDTENQQLQQSLMLALISQGRFDESLPYAEKLKSVPDIERFSRLALAVDAIRKKEYRSAETFLKLAQESDLDKLISGVMTAWAKAGAGDAKDALAYLEKLQGPEWFTLFTTYHRALIAEAAGNAKEAEKIYSETIDNVAAGGAAPETWLRAAEAYAGFLAGRGEKDKALAVLDKADEFATGRLPLMALREKINKGDKITPLVAGPADGASEILLDLASALNRGGGEPFVRLYLQYALALKHDSDAVLLQLAAVAEQQENAEEAIELYRRVPADSSLKRAAELQLGLNLADLKRHDEAITHLKALLDESPDDMRAYLALGGVYSSKEDYRSAADIYDKAVERLKAPDASNWNIYYQRGIAYERLKEWPKAEPNFREALKLMPNQPQVLNYLGYSWVDMNMNLDEGLDMIRKAVDLRPSDGYIVDSLGWAYYRLNRFDEAVTELERAVSLKPDDPVLNDHLGDAYWRVGRKLEATFQWSHARDMKPEPDVLATVQKKLAEGLPPLEGKTAAEAPAVKPAAPAVAPAPAPEAEKKSDTPAATPQSSPVEKISATPAAYKVQRGQSLWSIANEVLGNGGRYQEILNLNPELRGDPGRIVPGQQLILPVQPN
ncbi:tetratricopeptide repeat protein [Mesorhizobium sp. YR577]|uniref:tetratricopeptide repeat protein n=1 Tax=Mesorhizobium sp. YR577 TaxID=1884373 RepID=UPI0008E01678|nr:tetratricopeptide repeat protein [Mesorhizobium sp. YR577]SFT94942.1 Tetratricopeptide repeat-containing protein [Mesorhizobium sp. YR577]